MQVVEFKYDGGSKPGAIRRVLFPGDKPEGYGFDLDAEEPRRFTAYRMKNVTPIKATIVALDNLPASFDHTALLIGYRKEGKEALYADMGGSGFVVAMDKKPRADYYLSTPSMAIGLNDRRVVFNRGQSGGWSGTRYEVVNGKSFQYGFIGLADAQLVENIRWALNLH